MHFSRWLLSLFLVLSFQLGHVSSLSSIFCNGKCPAIVHAACGLFNEVIVNQSDCCSKKSGKPPQCCGKPSPCCNVKQGTPEDNNIYLPASRLNLTTFFHTDVTSAENPGIINQRSFLPREYLSLNPAPSAPVYLLNLTFLC
jgi:hypothetical protein